MMNQIIASLHRVRDPEIPMDVYEMGLIYDIRIEDPGVVFVRMTLTAPNCPVAGSLPGDVERAVRSVAGVTDAKVELTFDPPWSKERMSEAAKLALGMDDVVVPLTRLRR
jgi:FeS assembly SUF system protein